LAQGVPAPAQVNEPYISISPDYFYPLEEILYIEGRANPNAIVTVSLRKEGALAKESDKQGVSQSELLRGIVDDWIDKNKLIN